MMKKSEVNNGNYRNNLQDKRLDTIENHIKTTNEEMGDIKVDVAEIKKDVSWIKKFFWIVATTSIASFIALLAQIFNVSL